MNNDVVIFANFDTSNYQDPESNFFKIDDEKLNVLNSVSNNIVLGIRGEPIPSKLSFSTNGIDGIGKTDDTFNIGPIYYTGQKVYFTIKYKTDNNFSINNYPKLSLGNGINQISLSCFQIQTLSSVPVEIYVDDITFNSNDTLSALNGGGYFRGYFVSDQGLSNLKIKGESNTGTATITGESDVFDLYPTKGFYKYRKINEDNDQKQNYKDLIFQDILTNKDNFFNNFLGTSVGDLSGNLENLGIKIYEKISNFVSNTNDINYSNLKNFVSQLENLNVDFERFNIEYPPSLQRLVDNLSINLSLQKGSKNNYNFDFDKKGYDNNPDFGKNLGNNIPVLNGIVQPYKYGIVAYEKFSEKYKVINTNLLSAYDMRFRDTTTKSFPLSDYQDAWGWGLILPDNLGKRNFIQLEGDINTTNSFLQIENGLNIGLSANNQPGYYRLTSQTTQAKKITLDNHYNFYRYNDDVIEGSQLQKFIDYDNGNNTMGNLNSFFNYSKKGGVMDDLIINNLFKNTGLVEDDPYPTESSFVPHYMYDDLGNEFYAETYQQHIKYKSLGYQHSPPVGTSEHSESGIDYGGGGY